MNELKYLVEESMAGIAAIILSIVTIESYGVCARNSCNAFLVSQANGKGF